MANAVTSLIGKLKKSVKDTADAYTTRVGANWQAIKGEFADAPAQVDRMIQGGNVYKDTFGYKNPQTLGQKTTNTGLGLLDNIGSASLRGVVNTGKGAYDLGRLGYGLATGNLANQPDFKTRSQYLDMAKTQFGDAMRFGGTTTPFRSVQALKTATPAIGLYSGLEGGLNVLNDKSGKSRGMKFAEGAVSGLERGVPMAGVGTVSNPYISKLMDKRLTTLGKLTIGVPANIAEGYAMNKSAGMDYTKEDALIDALVPGGLVLGKASLDQIKGAISQGVKDKKITKETAKQLDNYIMKNGRKYWAGKVNGQFATKDQLQVKTPYNTVKTYFTKQKISDINNGKVVEKLKPMKDSISNLSKTWQNMDLYDKTGKLLGNTEQFRKFLADNPELAAFAPVPEITTDESGKIQIKEGDYNLGQRAVAFGALKGVKSEAGQKLIKGIGDSLKRGSEGVQNLSKDFDKNFPEAMNIAMSASGNAPVKGVANYADDVLTVARKQIGEAGKVKLPIKQKVGQAWDTFYRDWVNRFQPVEDLVKNVEKAGKLSLMPENNPTIQIKRLLGAGGIAEYRHKTKLQPILDSVKNDISIEDFDVFLKAKRDLELAGRGIKGSDAGQANAVLQALRSKYNLPKIEEAATKLYQYQDEGLQMLRDGGFIDESVYNVIKDANKNYVPFQRVMDELDNYLGLPTSKLQNPSQPLKKIEGSNRAIYSPIESIIANTYKIESAVSKNKVAKSIANLGAIVPDTVKPVVKSGDNTISIWDGGKKAYFEIDADISQAVKGLNEEQMGTVLKILSAPASMLRQQATGRNIDFMIPNVVRDQFEAAINAKYGYVPFWDYMRGMKDLIEYDRTGSNPIVEGWIQNGGQMFFESMSGRKNIQKQIMDATTKKRLTRRLYDLAINGIEKVGRYSETPTRLGVYKRALEKTGNMAISAGESREATLDFARRGAKMSQLNAVVPFLNASIQGFDRMARSVKERPGKALTLLTIYGGVPALMTTLYNNLNFSEEYANVPDFVKNDNFVIMTGGTDEEGNSKYITIPKAHNVKPIANATQQMIDYWSGSNPQTFKQFALSTLSSTVPLLGEGDSFSSIASNTVGSNLPQAFKPAVQQVTNFDFYKNKDIVPFYMEKKPLEAQFNKATPDLYKRAGALTGTSPLRLQNFAESTLPMAKQVTNAMDLATSLRDGEPMNPNKIPVVRRFSGSYSGFDTERPIDTGTGIGDKITEFLKPNSQSSAASKEPTVLDEKTVRKVDNIAKTYGYDSYLQEKPTKDLELQKYQKSVLSDAKKVLKDEYMKETDKLALVQRMGLDAEDVKYDILANSDTVDRAIYVRDELAKAKTSEERYKLLTDLYNNKSLSDSRVFTESVAEELGLKDAYDLIYKEAKAKTKKSTKKINTPKMSFKKTSFKPASQSEMPKLGIKFEKPKGIKISANTDKGKSGVIRLQKKVASI